MTESVAISGRGDVEKAQDAAVDGGWLRHENRGTAAGGMEFVMLDRLKQVD